MSVTLSLKIKQCVDCPNHTVEVDPDPHDWFCSDDVKVVCQLTNKNVTVACRPYNLRKETDVPDWCPLRTPESKPEHPCAGAFMQRTCSGCGCSTDECGCI